MVLELHTDYDLAHLEELQRVMSKAVNSQIARSTKRIYYACGGFVLALVLGITAWTGEFKISGVLLALLGAFCIERGVNYYKHTAEGVRKRMSAAFTGNDYILDELGVRVENAMGVIEYNYSDCTRLLETNGNIYALFNDGQGLILDKGNVKGGSAEDLRRWLEKNCGKKLEWVDLAAK